jgi:hypothetical protein
MGSNRKRHYRRYFHGTEEITKTPRIEEISIQIMAEVSGPVETYAKLVRER